LERGRPARSPASDFSILSRFFGFAVPKHTRGKAQGFLQYQHCRDGNARWDGDSREANRRLGVVTAPCRAWVAKSGATEPRSRWGYWSPVNPESSPGGNDATWWQNDLVLLHRNLL